MCTSCVCVWLCVFVCVCFALRQACAERGLVLVKSEGEPEYLQREREGKQERPLGHCPVEGQTLEWERERKHTHVREKASFIQVCVKHRSTQRNERPFNRCTAQTLTRTHTSKRHISTDTHLCRQEIVTLIYTDIDKHTRDDRAHTQAGELTPTRTQTCF